MSICLSVASGTVVAIVDDHSAVAFPVSSVLPSVERKRKIEKRERDRKILLCGGKSLSMRESSDQLNFNMASLKDLSDIAFDTVRYATIRVILTM